jgi:hypothetical protein
VIERWEAVNGTHGMIEVSTFGRVRSLLRPSKTVLKLQTDKKGYQRVRVTICGEKIGFKVHREVAKAFIPNPDNKPQVNHIDGNKSNNAVENLEWVTNQENAHHAIATGLFNAVIAGAKRSNDDRKRPIIAYDPYTGKGYPFDSVSAAEKWFRSRHITDVLKGRRKHVNGWVFAYDDEREGVRQ